MELMPMPMAQTPKTLFSSVVKRVDRCRLNTVPNKPPSATASTLTTIPIISVPPYFPHKNTPVDFYPGVDLILHIKIS